MSQAVPNFRQSIAAYIQTEAQPPDKFSHQPRLYALAQAIGEGQLYDDDVLYAAAWLHDLGVFVHHRPKDLAALATWDNVAYALRVVPDLLQHWHFPADKIPPVVEAIRTHLPSQKPTSLEGHLLREADILEQLGAVGILRTVSKVGRDTRFPTHAEAIKVIRRNYAELPARLSLHRTLELAKPRLAVMAAFLEAADLEAAAAGL
ncbi:MAG: phosphohydrolase [Verrucomicrobiota bacterium]